VAKDLPAELPGASSWPRFSQPSRRPGSPPRISKPSLGAGSAAAPSQAAADVELSGDSAAPMAAAEVEKEKKLDKMWNQAVKELGGGDVGSCSKNGNTVANSALIKDAWKSVAALRENGYEDIAAMAAKEVRAKVKEMHVADG